MSHPLFDPKTFEYDLALIRFTEPILYERNILPVCVPQGNDSYVDRMATVIGWGRLFEGKWAHLIGCERLDCLRIEHTERNTHSLAILLMYYYYYFDL